MSPVKKLVHWSVTFIYHDHHVNPLLTSRLIRYEEAKGFLSDRAHIMGVYHMEGEGALSS